MDNIKVGLGPVATWMLLNMTIIQAWNGGWTAHNGSLQVKYSAPIPEQRPLVFLMQFNQFYAKTFPSPTTTIFRLISLRNLTAK
jgi:hypothetical protein